MSKIKRGWERFIGFFKIEKDASKQVKTKKIITLAFLALVLLFIIFVIVFAVGIYKYKWNNQVSQKVIQIIPYPAALVGFSEITLFDFQQELGYIKQFFEKSKQPMPDEQEIKNQLLNDMIEKKILAQQSRKYNIAVSKSEVDEEYQNIARQNKGEEEVKKILNDLYGINEIEFKRMIKDQLLREKMRDQIPLQIKTRHIFVQAPSTDKAKVEEGRKKIQSYQEQVKKGADFAKLAAEHSEDQSTKDKGGERGYITRGSVEKEYEDAAFKLKVGEVSDIVQTKTGFFIIKVEDIKGKVDSNFEDWLSETIKKTKVFRFI